MGDTLPSEASTIFVVSGPSGGGKGTAISYLVEHHRLRHVTTATTRQPRRDEVDGRDYHFFGVQEFVARGQRDEFFEYVRTYGTNAYAAPSSLLFDDSDVPESVVELDPQGFIELKARSVRRVVGLFLMPPSYDEMRKRILSRSPVDDLSARVDVAANQLVLSTLYDYATINGSKARLHKFIDSMIDVERSRRDARWLARELVRSARHAAYSRLQIESEEGVEK